MPRAVILVAARGYRLEKVEVESVKAFDDESKAILTRGHYENYPFVEGGEVRIARWDRRLRNLVPGDSLRGQTIADLGCGSGEISQALARRGARMVCVDLTSAALNRARNVDGSLPCQADVLHLPFREGIFDQVISIGVLHHTPDCRAGLIEAARVTKSRGRIVVLLYSHWTPYHVLYSLAAPLRARVSVTRLEKLPHWALGMIRIFAFATTHLKYDDDQLRRLIADQIWSPQVTFHSRNQIQRWGLESGLILRKRLKHLLYSDVYIFERV